MSAIKRIREALAAGPTPGPWYLRTNRHPTTNGRAWGWLDTQPPGGSQYGPPGLQITWERGSKSEANADYIAACNPENVAALLAELDRLTRERDEARAELERERMRLAACGVVAMSNTPESAARNREMHADYRSASCDDVASAVDREMALRAEVDALRADAERLSSLAYPPFCDEYNEVDLHEQAAIYASAFGREEPNRDDYLAALRDAVDAALAQADAALGADR